MRKAWVIARAEFLALVRSKAFIVSVLVLPIFVIGLQLAQVWLSAHADRSPRRFAVLDPSGAFYDALVERTKIHNEAALAADEAPFVVERIETDGRSIDELRLQLSDRIRGGELFAFADIPGDLMEHPERALRYYSANGANAKLSAWLASQLEEVLRARIYREAALSPRQVVILEQRVGVESLGLYTRTPEGRIKQAEKHDLLRSVIVPIIPPVLLFFFVVVSAPQHMNLVLVEKMSRISEVLLGSLSPFQLMTGKLLGSVGVSLLLGVLYVSAGLFVAHRFGLDNAVAPSMVAWFLAFLVVAMLLYGSICIAVGAACTDLKDAQNLMMPVLMPLMLPMMLLVPIVESPDSPVAVAFSLFPLASPILVLLRLGLSATMPTWQVVAGMVGSLVTACACVWAAGRIFRIGLLSSGKSATVREMIGWALRG